MKKLRKWSVGLGVAVFSLLFMGITVFAAVKPTAISIKADSSQMTVGAKMDLESKIAPKNAKVPDRNIIWSSSDSRVIKVKETRDDDTEIKALREGKATITVKIKGTNLKAAKTITVVKKGSAADILAGVKTETSKCKKLIQSYEKKIAAMKPTGDEAADRRTYLDMEKKLDAVDNRLEKAGDKLEDLYRDKDISAKTYRTYDSKLEDLEDAVGHLEDELENIFGDDDYDDFDDYEDD